MVSLTALLLPILLSAVIVFVASSVIHMVLKYHTSDYRELPEEDKLLATLRPAGLTPGLYHFPYCSHKDMNSPAMQEKFKQGPVGFLTVFPSGPVAMPKFLIACSSVFSLLISRDAPSCPAHRIWPCFASRAPPRSLLSAWGPWSTASGRASPGAWFSKKLLMVWSTVY